MRRAFLGVMASVVSLTCATAAWACPDCPVGRAARQQALGDGLATRLLIALLPFAFVGLASFWAERIGRR